MVVTKKRYIHFEMKKKKVHYMTNITEAVRWLEQGKFVLIFDSAGREKETTS